MAFSPSRIKAIIFDYGNTLIRFDRTHALACDNVMIELLQKRCGPVDRERFIELRSADRLEPYRNGYREQKLRDLFVNHIRQLYGVEPGKELLAEMAAVRFETFVNIIQSPPGLHEVLEQLQSRYPLAILSNYPDGEAIRASIDTIGIAGYFRSIVVSGDVGRVKPHPAMYEAVLEGLESNPEETLHVGDNWLADIQGGKRAGLNVCHITTWETPERFEPAEGDFSPDMVIRELAELPGRLNALDAAAGDSG